MHGRGTCRRSHARGREHAGPDGDGLRLNGMGVRSFTFLQVHGYVAGLYVPRPSHDASAILNEPGIKLLQIQYVHSAGIERVENEFRRGRAMNCAGGCPKSDDAAFEQLVGTARAVKPGDTSTYVYGPDGVQVLFDGKKLATIHDAGFSRRMLQGMIGDHPPTVSLRDGLLGIPRD
jgi:hypothetical protein